MALGLLIRRVVWWSSDLSKRGLRVIDRSSGLCFDTFVGPLLLTLELLSSLDKTLGGAYRSGLLPYPRSVSTSLAPKWIEV